MVLASHRKKSDAIVVPEIVCDEALCFKPAGILG
jgi:hypothetical protein